MVNKISEKLNELIRRVPRELLANTDLTFRIEANEAEDPNRAFIDIVLKSKWGLADLAYIGFDSNGDADANFVPTDSGDCEADSESKIYCNKAEYGKEVGFDGMHICPYTSVCNQVETFIKKYVKEHKIKLMNK